MTQRTRNAATRMRLRFILDVLDQMERHGYTVAYLAAALRWTRPQTIAFLQGRTAFNFKTIAKVSAALGCDVKVDTA